MKLRSTLGNIKHVEGVERLILHTKRFDASLVASERLRIIEYYSKLGERACIDAFGVDRKLLCVWRKRLKRSGGSLSSLVPDSTAPKNTRKMSVNVKIIEFIKELREEHPRLGKMKIKPLLDEYCEKQDLPTYSTAKIGRIITRYKLFYQKQGKMYHNPNSGFASNNTKRSLNSKKAKRLRVKYSPKHKELGHIQMDTVVRIEDGIRQYMLSAVDTKSKFALSLPQTMSTAQNNLEFFKAP